MEKGGGERRQKIRGRDTISPIDEVLRTELPCPLQVIARVSLSHMDLVYDPPDFQPFPKGGRKGDELRR